MAGSDDARRAVLVTGASRGIGAAIAGVFARSGDRVAVHYGSREDHAREVQASLPGDGHLVVGADLMDASAVRRMVDEVAEAFAGIDVLVNNAGIFEPHPITDTSYWEWQESWRRTLGVNLTGAANVTWCAVQHMGRPRPDRQHRLRAGRFAANPTNRSYGGGQCKGRTDRVRPVAGARARAARRSRSPAVAPGFTETDMAATGSSPQRERGQARRAESPLGRVATAEEVAAAVFYLASPAAELASGAVLDVNGASYLRM